MKVTIIPIDGAVYKDSLCYSNLDLSQCGIPDDIHALQWFNTEGWIEFKSDIPNEKITELPQWALNCLDVWQIAYDADHPVDPPVDPIV